MLSVEQWWQQSAAEVALSAVSAYTGLGVRTYSDGAYRALGLRYWDCQHKAWQLSGTPSATGASGISSSALSSIHCLHHCSSLKLFSLLTSQPWSFLCVASPAHSPKDKENTSPAQGYTTKGFWVCPRVSLAAYLDSQRRPPVIVNLHTNGSLFPPIPGFH